MPAVRRNRVVEVLWRLHRWAYQRTGGRVGGRLMNMPVLLLTTTGRQSRRARTTALSYLGDGDRYVVIASNAGESRHPGWFLNLKADPRAHVQVGPHRLPVRAWEAAGDERERLWARVVEADHSYAEYQRRTRRRIPIVILQPEHGTAPRLPV